MRAAAITPRRQFALAGRGWRLLSDLGGGRPQPWWATSLLRGSSRLPVGRPSHPVGGWERIFDLAAPHVGVVSDALLIHTAWYKDSSYAGLLEGPGGRVFVKIHGDASSADHEARGHLALEPLYGPALRFPAVLVASDEVIVTAAIRPTATTVAPEVLTAGATEVGRIALHGEAVAGLPELTEAERDRLSRLVTRDLAQLVESVPHAVKALPTGTAHGDLVPWNVLASSDGDHLIDLEAWGDYPAFFDLVHLRLQPHALAAREDGQLRGTLAELRRSLMEAGAGTATDPLITAACFLEVRRTLGSHLRWPKNVRLTTRAVRFYAAAVGAMRRDDPGRVAR